MNTSRTAAAPLAGLALVTALLAGCAPTGEQGTPARGPEQEVAQLALKEAEANAHANDVDHEVVLVEEWQDGYGVLVATEGENDNGAYTNWTGFGFVPDGDDGWRLEIDTPVGTAEGQPDYPRRALCIALVPSDAPNAASARDECRELDE